MVDIDNWLVAHEPSRNVVQTIRVIIVCVGLIVVVPSVLEWTGFFPAVLETLSSAENEESQSSTARMVSTATVVAIGVLLLTPYRAVRSQRLRAVFSIGLILITVRVCWASALMIVSVAQGEKDPTAVWIVMGLSLIFVGNLWIFGAITNPRSTMSLSPHRPLQPTDGNLRFD
jgi:hypothetical protein